MLKISAMASQHEVLGDAPADLRQRLREMTGQNFRRINRFIALALCGALRCRDAAGEIASGSALYLACDSPMLADSSKILQGIHDERRPPSPFEFMNIAGNMAGFYIGEQLKLSGPQLALHRNRVGLEAALELLSLQSGRHRQTLLGCVEEGVWPLQQQRQRLGLRADAPLAECSHWFYLDADCDAPLATIERCERYGLMEDAAAALQDFPAGTVLALDAAMQAERGEWHARLGLPEAFDDQAGAAFSNGGTALALCRFISSSLAPRLLHLSRGDGGEIHLLLVSKSVPSS